MYLHPVDREVSFEKNSDWHKDSSVCDIQNTINHHSYRFCVVNCVLLEKLDFLFFFFDFSMPTHQRTVLSQRLQHLGQVCVPNPKFFPRIELLSPAVVCIFVYNSAMFSFILFIKYFCSVGWICALHTAVTTTQYESSGLSDSTWRCGAI